MRLLWVSLLVAPAGVVFVATETALGPIASAERLDVAAPASVRVALPGVAVGITTPARGTAGRVYVRRTRHRVVRPPRRIAPSPTPRYVIPSTAVTHVAVGAPTTSSRVTHTPKPKPKPKPKPVSQPKPAPAPTPTPAPTPPVSSPPTTSPTEPTPPAQPPEQPNEPTPTPAAPPAPVPTPPVPTPAKDEGDDDDRGEDADDTRPGNGWGDSNHEHTGPPGKNGDHGHGNGNH